MRKTEKTELDEITREIAAIKIRLSQIEQSLQLKTAKEKVYSAAADSDEDSGI